MIENACLISERACLSGLFKHGGEAYLDVETLVDDDCFTDDSNLRIWMSAKHVFEQDNEASLDLTKLQLAAKEIGFGSFFDSKDELKYVRSLIERPVELRDVRKFAAKISRLRLARLMAEQLGGAIELLKEVKGNESISSIFGIAENVVFDFSKLMRDGGEGPQKIGDGLTAYLQDLADNPVQQIGIPTGFPEYDKAIGGGIRKNTVNIIVARLKVGKTLILRTMARNIAKAGYQVLYMDSEMTKEEQIPYLTGLYSGVDVHDIENGQFGQDQDKYERVMAAAREIEGEGKDGGIPLYHQSMAGMPIEEQLAIMRRWIIKTVKPDANGKYPCTIVYDYVKMMSSESITNNIAEHQALGFLMSSLHNFTIRYGCSILAACQVNREGISKEDSSIAAGSDRIGWLCANLAVLKTKSPEELSQEKGRGGSRKLVIMAARHGRGTVNSDYICVDAKPEIGLIREIGLLSQVRKNASDEGFVIEGTDGDEDDTCPFE